MSHSAAYSALPLTKKFIKLVAVNTILNSADYTEQKLGHTLRQRTMSAPVGVFLILHLQFQLTLP